MGGNEFRTEAPGSSSDDGNASSSFIDEAMSKIEGSKTAQAQIAAVAEQNGIDPNMAVMMLPDLSAEDYQTFKQQQKQQQDDKALPDSETDQTQPGENQSRQDSGQSVAQEPEVRTVTKTEKPSAEQLISFLGQVIELTDEDMSLKELKQWAEDNTDMVETAIEMEM